MSEWSNALGFDWRLLLPLLVIQVILWVVALIDLKRTDKELIRVSKWLWLVVIVVGEIFGPVIYFVFGKRKEV